MKKSIIISLLLLGLPQLAAAHSGESFSGMPHHMMNIGSGWMGWWWVAMLVFWVLVISAVVAFILRLFQRDKGKSDPKEILEQRLARGEISQEEFEQKLDQLNES